jgi:hypothetical protein
MTHFGGSKHGPAVLAMLALSFPANAQDSAEADEVEEIIVYAEKNLVTLRTVFLQSEDRFLARFNELNTDPLLEIECDVHVRLEDRRRIRTCTPLFYRKLEARTTFEMMEDGRLRASSAVGRQGGGITFRTPRFETQRKEMNERLTKAMLTLMAENPDFLEAYQDMSAAKREYETFREDRRQKRFGDE